jgi:hypothetical protein
MSRKERPMKRPSKKTEMLEVRVSPEEKTAFLEACRKVGLSASGVIRDAMRAYANFGPMTRLPGSPIMIASAFAGAALGAFFVSQVVFEPDTPQVLDVLSFSDFRDRDLNDDRVVSRQEFEQSHGQIRVMFEHSERDGGHKLGAVVGYILVGHDLDISRFFTEPEIVSEACWDGLETAYQLVIAERFSDRDLNGDGQIHYVEYSDYMMLEYRSIFELQDVDQNGVLTIEDLTSPSRPVEGLAPDEPEPGYVETCRSDVGGTSGQTRVFTARNPMGDGLAARLISSWDLDGNLMVSLPEYIAARP